MEQTSIAVSKKSKDQWIKFKNHPNESFEDMINRILKSAIEEDADLLTDKDVLEIEKSMREIKKGKFITHKQLKKKYGL
jgi:hypothetical protein